MRVPALLTVGSAAGLLLGILASRALASIVYQATPRDPLVLAGVVLAMALLGLVATWIPAQRALSIDPSDPAARGMSYRGPAWNRFFDSQEESRASPPYVLSRLLPTGHFHLSRRSGVNIPVFLPVDAG